MSSFDPAYPIWAEVVQTSAEPSSGASRPGGAGGSTSSTTSAISDVLGWRVNLTDAAGIKRALSQAFAVTKVDGKSVVKWQPRNFRVQSVQRGEGAIGGAQLSLWERARVVVDQAIPLVHEVTSLGTDEDRENVDAIRELIVPELQELVEQLGAEGGPVVQRIDTIFTLLLDYQPSATPPVSNATTVGGQLGLLRDRLELDGQKVNTIEEERVLTRFHTLVSYVDMLLQSWHRERQTFNRSGNDESFATQSTLLERRLSVIVESVGELRHAMRSVFLGDAEQEAITLQVGKGSANEPAITIKELLDWVVFTAERGFDILRLSGRDGAQRGLAPSLARVLEVLKKVQTVDQKLGAFKTKRVEAALAELTAHVSAAHLLAAGIRREPKPVIYHVTVEVRSKASHSSPNTTTMFIYGRRFDRKATVELLDDSGKVIAAERVTWQGPAHLRAFFDQPVHGGRVQVTNSTGTSAISDPIK